MRNDLQVVAQAKSSEKSSPQKMMRSITMNEIEERMLIWQNTIENWCKRLPWSDSSDKKVSLISIRFLRTVLAECWIHWLANNKAGDSNARVRVIRIYRELIIYWPGLAIKIEQRLPKTTPKF